MRVAEAAVDAMSAWMARPSSFEWPYPTEEERRGFVEEGGITDRQVINWFSNARKRHWKVRLARFVNDCH
jgi:hypothetical protein